IRDLLRGGRDVEAHRLDCARKVVIRVQVTADELEDRFHLLADRRENELVAPDGMPSELALIRLDPLGDETPAAFARPEGPCDLGDAFGGERGPQLAVVAHL